VLHQRLADVLGQDLAQENKSACLRKVLDCARTRWMVALDEIGAFGDFPKLTADFEEMACS